MFSTSKFIDLLSNDTYTKVGTEIERLRPYYDHVREYYNASVSHASFIFSMVTEMRAKLASLNIECIPDKIQAARDRLTPILQNFRERKDATERASQALLYIIVEYIHSHGFALKAENTPALAVYGVNAFLVAISSTIVLSMSVQNVLNRKDTKVL